MARDLERQQATGERIKALRESRPDLTQPKIAEYVGVGLRAYQFWEAGDTGIAHDNVVKLAELFGVSTAYLYDGEEETQEAVPDVIAWLRQINAKLDAILKRLGAEADLDLAGALSGLVDPAPDHTETEAPEQPQEPARRSRKPRAA